VRLADLSITNLETEEQLRELRDVMSVITGVEFVAADLDSQMVEFSMAEDLDDITLTDIQCALRDAGFEAGEVVEGQTCTLRLVAR
jgi:hypothetical protein